MVLISATFIGVGLAFASRMKDMSGFGLIMNFMIFPVFLLSGALFPVQNLPGPVRILSYIDPLTYGVDALRGCLVGANSFPVILDALLLTGCCAATMAIGAYLFETSEID
jgi:ABC-2 type transport system permease protein